MKNITKLIIVAVGGQGNLLASKVLGEAALESGRKVHMSEIHGMAQRGGVVESSIVFGDAKSPVIADGEADIMVGFEPLETVRALSKCNKETILITNTHPFPPFTSAIGQAEYPDIKDMEGILQSKVKEAISFNATDLAIKAGSSLCLNMVLLGALAETGVIPLDKKIIKKTISEKTKKAFVEMNLKAFDSGCSIVSGLRG